MEIATGIWSWAMGIQLPGLVVVVGLMLAMWVSRWKMRNWVDPLHLPLFRRLAEVLYLYLIH